MKLTRRAILGSGAVAAGATLAAEASAALLLRPSQPQVPSTFVLVHGAWHGSWCWKRVRKQLQTGGHEVFTPTLTGLGETSHLLSRSINLETHIADIVNLIRWEDLANVVLCGHSYGGCVISGVAEQAPDKIGSLVYLDAFVLDDGQSLYDTIPAAMRDAQIEEVKRHGEGWKVPPIPAAQLDVNPADRSWVDAKTTPQPLATFQQSLRLNGATAKIDDIRYILASKSALFRTFAEKAREQGWRTTVIDSGHNVMLDNPQALVEELLAAGAAVASS